MTDNLLQTTAPATAPIDFNAIKVAPAAPAAPAAAPTPAPAPAPAAAPATSPSPQPISVSSLNTPATPYVAPPAAAPSQTATGISGAADASLESHTALETKLNTAAADAKIAADSGTTDLKATMDKILGVQGSQQQVQDSYHVDELGKLNNDAFTALQASKRAQDNEVKAATQAAGGTTAGANEAVAAINRKYAFEQADLSIALDVSNRNYLAASQTADKKIQMQLQPLETLLNFQTTFFNANKNALSDAEKNQLQSLITDNQRKYDEAKSAAKTLSDTKLETMKQAQQNGAPAAILNAIATATSPQAAITAAGTYGVDKLKLAQIAAANALASQRTHSSTGGLGVSPELQQAIADGLIDPNKVNSRTLGIYNSLAKAHIDAAGAHATIAGNTKAYEDATRYATVATRVVNVLEKNMPLLAGLADKVNASGIPGIDQYVAGAKVYTGGDPDAVKYISTLKTLRSEYAQMLARGAAVTESDKAEAAGAIPAGLSGDTYLSLKTQLQLEGRNIIDVANQTKNGLFQSTQSKGVNGTDTSGLQGTLSSGITWHVIP